MRTRPFSGDWPLAASWVWQALDRSEIRTYAKVEASLRSTRLAQLGGRWTHRTASDEDQAGARRRATKWADVTTTRGLAWLVGHHLVSRAGDGYIRVSPRPRTALHELLDACVEAEQQLRGVRTIWEANPNYPGPAQSYAARVAWDQSLERLLTNMERISKGLKSRLWDEKIAESERRIHGAASAQTRSRATTGLRSD